MFLYCLHGLQYESIEEGMAATIDIYIKVLLHLITTRGFEVFVHPVPPVLNETRTVVTAFVKMLKTKVGAGSANMCVGCFAFLLLGYRQCACWVIYLQGGVCAHDVGRCIRCSVWLEASISCCCC